MDLLQLLFFMIPLTMGKSELRDPYLLTNEIKTFMDEFESCMFRGEFCHQINVGSTSLHLPVVRGRETSMQSHISSEHVWISITC